MAEGESGYAPSSLASDVIRLRVYKCKIRADGISLDPTEPCNVPSHGLECKATFYVHKELLCQNSDVFQRELNGHMKEAKEKTIELLDWDFKTVERLVEFLYTGDYRNPTPVSLSLQKPTSEKQKKTGDSITAGASSSAPASGSTLFPKASPCSTTSISTGSAKSGGLPPTSECIYSPSRNVSRSHHPLIEVSRHNTKLCCYKYDSATHSYTEALLSHAAMYVLGEKYDLRRLCALAFDKVRTLLSEAIPADILREGLVPLIEFVYANTPTPHGSNEEPLRNLVSLYAAWHVKTLNETIGSDWEGLVSEGGDFVRDFFRKITIRMINLQYVDESEAKPHRTPSTPTVVPPQNAGSGNNSISDTRTSTPQNTSAFGSGAFGSGPFGSSSFGSSAFGSGAFGTNTPLFGTVRRPAGA